MKQKNKNIGMVLDGYYPSDIRVRKEAESLVSQFNVFILCAKRDSELEEEIVNNVKIIRAISYKSATHKGIIDVLLSINFVHPLFKKKLNHFVRTYSIDVLHTHDLPLAKTVYLSAKKYNLKSVIDLHENYPEALKTWFSWRKSTTIRLKNEIFFNYLHWKKYEKTILPKYDRIIAVVKEMKEQLIVNHQINESQISIITNTEKKEFARFFNQKYPEILKPYSNRYIIAYVGGIGPHRGLQTAIKAIKNIQKEIPNILLAIIGPAHPDVFSFLNQLIKDEAVENAVHFFGRQDFQMIPQIMQNVAINIIPHESNAHTNSTIPHKLFQILMSGKPLLVSNCKPLLRVVKSYDLGWVFQAGNPSDFAKIVIKISKDTILADERIKNGKEQCINRDLNWESTAEKLIDLYNELLLNQSRIK